MKKITFTINDFALGLTSVYYDFTFLLSDFTCEPLRQRGRSTNFDFWVLNYDPFCLHWFLDSTLNIFLNTNKVLEFKLMDFAELVALRMTPPLLR